MREFASPRTVDLPRTGSLTDDVVRNEHEAPDHVCFSVRGDDGWTDVTAAAFAEQVRAVAKGLVAAGLEPGDRVVLCSRTRYEWTLVDYAAWWAGCVTVPVYETSSTHQLELLLRDSGARAAVVETDRHRARVDEAVRGGARVEKVWTIRDGGIERLVASGAGVSDEALEERRAAVRPDTLATIIYTSGTTGRPRGCMLTHGAFMAELGQAVEELDELFAGDDAATLLFLPLAHVFARVIQVGAVRRRVRLGHSDGVRHLTRDLREFRPTFVLAVPRVFEKVFNAASQQAAIDGHARTFDKAADTAIAWSRSQDDGGPGRLLRLRHRIYDRTVYARLRETLGGRCAYAVSGGAPLGERLGHFFRGIGVTVLEGYGLTETTAAITVNRPDAVKIGTVGRPLGGTTIRVSDEGELEVSGDQLMTGYWQDPETTTEVLHDGWLCTGDLGEIDDEGFVRVTGRRKEILVTAGGKNVAPAPLEDHLRAHPLVSQCMVVGDGRPYVGALVTLDAEALRPWADARHKEGTVAALVDDPDLRAAVQEAVDDANRTVSKAESIRRFTILPVDWTEEDGQLTPSLKLRRAVVTQQFHREVDELYGR